MLTKVCQNDVPEVDFHANTMVLWPFLRSVEVAFSFYVAGAILSEGVIVIVSFLVAGAALRAGVLSS